jgi:hypothetical protein
VVASTSPFIMKLKRIGESIKTGVLLSVRISGLPLYGHSRDGAQVRDACVG